MAGKKFALEQVLGYRREIEKVRKQEFAAAQEGLYVANSELEREEQSVELLAQEFQSCQQEMGCIDDLKMYADYFARKREDIRQQKELIEQLDNIVTEKKADLLEASLEKKMLESLKEKKGNEFKQDMAARERNFLDEISVQKKVRTS